VLSWRGAHAKRCCGSESQVGAAGVAAFRTRSLRAGGTSVFAGGASRAHGSHGWRRLGSVGFFFTMLSVTFVAAASSYVELLNDGMECLLALEH